MTSSKHEQPRDIGFNSTLHVDGRELHVQTEVLGSSELIVRTTVNDGGLVRLAERQVYGGDPGKLEALLAEVEAQHNRHVQQITEDGSHGTP